MIAVIFESWPRPGTAQSYLEMGQRMNALVEGFDGFISIERFESVTEKGKFVSISFWRDEAAVTAWRNVVEHRRAQDGGRKAIFEDYRLRVASVIRDYGKTDRTEAPADSISAHG